MSCPGGSSIFGTRSQYIKTNGGDLIATDGSTTRERQVLSDLRIPYKQILKSRVILKAGQANYLLNHLGLGDNATFLSIRAIYDPKSVIDDDNYISWSYYDNLTRINYFSQLMILSGNTTKRVPQLYLTNPNSKYPVFLDVMVAVIDDQYSIFTDTINQTGTTFTGLEYGDIKTHIVDESIVINDKSSPVRPLIYINLSYINSIQVTSNILIIEDSAYGTIFLQFLTETDAHQAHSLINYVLENQGVNIDDLNPVVDNEDPVIYFYSNVGGTGEYIQFNGATSGVPYDTSYGFTFSTEISISTYGTASGTLLDKPQLINLLIDHIDDNRDGEMSIDSQNLVISATSGTVSSISNTGTYSLTFNFSDIAQNNLDGVIVNLNITA